MHTCTNPACRQTTTKLYSGVCSSCYSYRKNYKTERPPHVVQAAKDKEASRARGTCIHCGKSQLKLKLNRCNACYCYFNRTGQDCPLENKQDRPGWTVPQERRDKISRSLTGKVKSEESKLKASTAMKKVWQDPEAASRMVVPRVLKLSGNTRTSIELTAMATLTSMGYDIEVQKRIGRYVPDIVVESIKTIIECDGDYWHNKEGMPERDEQRDASHRAHGYTVVRLTESQIKQDCRRALLDAHITPQGKPS